jgi:hypothetical protein
MTAELFPLDGLQELSRLAFTQLLGRFSFARAESSPRHGTDGGFRVPFVPGGTHVAPPIIRRATPTGGASGFAVFAPSFERQFEIPLGR